MDNTLTVDAQKSALKKIIDDVARNIGINKKFHAWMGFLTLLLVACLYAYYIQLRDGLGVAGIRDYVSWGMYIANFVFFVASSLIGMLITAVLGLSGVKWITPVARIAEIIAIGFAAVAGLVIVSDMGRPERLAYVFMYGRIQSPILWDVTVVTTYVLISLILLYLPLIPDLKILSRNPMLPKWLQKTYELLSINWRGTGEQYQLLHKAIKIMSVLIVPVALAIHTVTSWLFASTSRVGWDSTIFGPYFVTGAFVAGTAFLIIAMYFFRKNYKLHDYLTDFHFDKLGKLLVLVSLVYLYFNINEFLVPAYKLKAHDAVHLKALFSGHHAPMFWSVQLFGLIIPIVLMLIKKFRKPLPLMLISLFVVVGSWFKRYLIVVPTQEHPFLPIQNVPENFIIYKPTLIESAITVASFVLVLMIVTVLSKAFPIVTIWETAHEKGIHEPEKLSIDKAE
jgi:molybdopterin-containing oxidoreductase family membrane subunit